MTGTEQKRIAFTVQYDGEAFSGWQLQPTQRSVQGELEGVISRILNTPTRVIGAGRTDRGVHATGQVAAVNVPHRWEPAEFRRAVNALLPRTIWVSHAGEVADHFHPRYDATSRRYVYRIGTSELSASPFNSRWCWSICRGLDADAMAGATIGLIGDHSFRSFAKTGQEQRGERCVVMDTAWVPWGEIGMEFHIAANRFLHHMVRYLVGTLVEIGMGRRPMEDVARLLQREPGLLTSPPAPPQGLYLTEVRYPEERYSASLPPSGAESGPPPSTFEEPPLHGSR